MKFAAIGATEKELITREANRDGLAWLPFARSVVLPAAKIVFPGINNALYVDHNGTVGRSGYRLTKNHSLGVIPVVWVVNSQSNALAKAFGGTAANDFLPVI